MTSKLAVAGGDVRLAGSSKTDPGAGPGTASGMSGYAIGV